MDLYHKADTINLINSDFSGKTLKNHQFKDKNGILVFYAPWCRHCQSSSSMWKTISSTFKNKFPIGVVNCDDFDNQNFKLLKTFNIKAYPTIKFVSKSGKVLDFDIGDTMDEIIYFIWTKLK